MLITAGLLFLYIDIWVGGVDFLPDLFGYILIFMALFRGWQYQKIYSSKLLTVGILTAALAVFATAERSSYLITLLVMMLGGVGQYLLVRGLYQSHSSRCAVSEKKALVNTALVLLLLCEICRPVLSLVPVMPYILLGVQLITGVFVTVEMWRVIKASK